MRIPLAYKFIFGFLAVVATAGLVPFVIEHTAVKEEYRNIISLCIAMVIGLILGSIFSRSFTKRFTYFTKAATKMGLGDLSYNEKEHAPKLLFPDETNDFEEALSLLFGNLRGLILSLNETSRKLSETQTALIRLIEDGEKTNEEVISSSSKIFEGALEQARHADSTANMVREVAAVSDDVSIKVADTLNASRQAHTIVEKGSTVSNAAIEKLEDIFEGLYKTESAVTHLKERINDIPRVLDMIIHISRQTDLLALNATIEASKAGEHGKGFALVAEEVRRFAESTNKSVEDISLIVRELKGEIESVVSNVANSSSYIKEGRDDIRKIRDIFSEISNYTAEVSTKADIIIDLTRRQQNKASHTVTIIEDLAGIAQSNLTTTESLDHSIENHGAAIKATIDESARLSALSKELSAVTSRFVVEHGFEDQAAATIADVLNAASGNDAMADEAVVQEELTDEEAASIMATDTQAPEQPVNDDSPLISESVFEGSEPEQAPPAPAFTPQTNDAQAEESPWLGEEPQTPLKPAASPASPSDDLPPAPWEAPSTESAPDSYKDRKKEKKELTIADLTNEDKDF